MSSNDIYQSPTSTVENSVQRIMSVAMKMAIKAAFSLAVLSFTMTGASLAESEVRIAKWDAAPVFQGAGWEFKIGGQVQYDYSALDTDNAGGDWNDSELRRLRLGVSGKFGERINYKFETNIDEDGEVIVVDAYTQWAPTGGPWNVKLGQFKTPNSLDEQTSSRFTSTLERAAFTDAFAFNHRLGASLNAQGDNYTLSAGVFAQNIEDESSLKGYALAGRATFTPVNQSGKLIHLGGSVRYRETGDNQSDLRFRQRPVSHIPGQVISTERIADSDVFVGAEVATIFGKFWTSGEYGVSFIDCSAASIASGACVDDPTFDGGYVEVGYFLGGSKTYKGGKFNRPKIDRSVINGGRGALAFVARFDTIDLSDTNINGGGYDSYIVGVDWWATKYSRLGVNFFRVDANLGATSSGLDAEFAKLVNANIKNEDINGVILRAQIDF